MSSIISGIILSSDFIKSSNSRIMCGGKLSEVNVENFATSVTGSVMSFP